MGIFSRKSKTKEVSVSPITLSDIFSGSDSLQTAQGQSTHGYLENPYVRRACDLYGVFASRPDTLVFDKHGQQLGDNHPLVKLLNHPNQNMDCAEFFTEIGTDIGIFGEAFVYPLKTIKGVVKLFPVDPVNVMVQETGDAFDPIRNWTISRGTAGTMTLNPEDLIHIKLFKSGTDVRGCSPIVSARKSIEMQNSIREWNIAMTRNGAKGSVIIEVPRALTDVQAEYMRQQLHGSYGGASNAGKGMILDDGKKATSLGMTAVEMDFVQGTAISAREVSISYGIAPEVLGDSQNKTYANMSEAYKQTVQTTMIPLLKKIYGSLLDYLMPFYPDVGRITYDVEQIYDLIGDQAEIYAALEQSTFLTANEKRKKLGYEPIPGADTLYVNMGLMPMDDFGTDDPGNDLDVLRGTDV